MSEQSEKPAATVSPVRFRARGFAPSKSRIGTAAALIFSLVAWQLEASYGQVNPVFLPGPAAIASALYTLAVSGDLWTNLYASLYRIVLGWLFGTCAGLALGIAMGLWTVARAVGMAYVSALFPIPKIALLPLLILWLGIGETSKVATIALGVFFSTVISVCSGVDSVPRNLIRMAQSFDMPFGAILWKIVLPGALPSILAGMRISTSFALLLVVSAEMIGTDEGIGNLVLQAGNLMQTDNLLAGVLVLSVLGLGLSKSISLIEERLLKWR